MLEVVAALLLGAVTAGLAVILKQQRTEVAVAEAPVPAAATPAAPPAPPRPATDPVGKVVDVLRRRKWARRGLSLVSLGLLVAAIGMLGYPVYTNWYADRQQGRLDRQLASPDLRRSYVAGTLEEGDALTRIRIPKIDIDVVVVEGVGSSALRAGAGHYPDTALPCEDGNVGIAGHRTTYGRPFHNLDLLEPGDVIILETPIETCTYEVARDPFVVTPNDVSVVADTPEPALTLTTCHPKGSARQRLIVRAAKVSTGSQGA